MLKHKIKSSLWSVFCVVFMAISCAETPSTTGEYPPSLPPVQSVQINASGLQDDSVTIETEALDSVGNFSRASDLTLEIGNHISSELSVPELLLITAHNHQPALNDRNQWEWSFTKIVDGNEVPIRMIATRSGDNQVEWNLYIVNSQLGLADQLYIRGSSNLDGTSGQWAFYYRNAESMEKRAQLEWRIREEENVHQKLKIISDRKGKGGSYIEYTFDGKRKTVTYFDANTDDLAEVHRNLDSNVGYIYSPAYNEGQQACWDKNYSDVLCSEI